MNWFEYLKESGAFDPKNNPEPVAVADGFTVPYWESLHFLEKLGLAFEKGQQLNLAPDVLSIIRAVSESPKDNHRTWYVLLRILAQIPNELIPIEFFHYIPVWLSGQFGSNLQSAALCEKLLPKFLKDGLKAEDFQKAELILKYLFTIKRIPVEQENGSPGESFILPIYHYYLRKSLLEEDVKEKIIRHCSDNVLFSLLDNINLLLRDYKVITEWELGDTRYWVEYTTQIKNYKLSIKKETGKDIITVQEATIENALEQPAVHLILDLEQRLNLASIPLPDNPKSFKRLAFGLSLDLFSILSHNSIHDLNDELRHGDDLIPLFALIARELLVEKAAQKPDEIKSLIVTILQRADYQFPFFKRLILYTISKQWLQLKDFFWQILSNNDPNHYFSEYFYQDEIYFLLRNVQHNLTEAEADILRKIFEIGPQGDSEFQLKKEIWQHRWLEALKDSPYFKEDFKKITHEHKLEERDYENENKMHVFIGNVSPYSEEEILEMPANELLEKILTFRNNPHAFRGPSIDGFADTLGKAVEKRPDHFDSIIGFFLHVPYVYMHYIIYGYTAAWKEGRTFDWKALLGFCETYIKNISFNDDLLVLPKDNVKADKEWVNGAIGRLISEGTRNDAYAYDAALLPITKRIVLQLSTYLKTQGNCQVATVTDYPMRSLNSSSGQILRGALDYALRKCRVDKVIQMQGARWEPEVVQIFDNSIENGIIDAYTLVGMYLGQFYYLDQAWTENKVRSWCEIEDSLWLAFIGGLSFDSPAANKNIYDLLYPHYRRAILTNKGFDLHYQHGIIRHLVAFYLWDYERIENPTSLNLQLITKSPTSILKAQAHFIYAQHKSFTEIDTKEAESLRIKILNFWKLLIEKYPVPENNDEKDLLGSLIHLTVYLHILEQESVDLLCRSLNHARKYVEIHNVLENLLRFCSLPEELNQAQYIARVLDVVPFSNFSEIDNTILIRLITYLFEHGEAETAKMICNKVQMEGGNFLRDIYFRYTN